MKRVISIFLAAMLIFSLLPVTAFADVNGTITEDGIRYVITAEGDKNEVILEDVVEEYHNVTNVVIPATVTDQDKTYSVTVIGGDAFAGCENLASVTISASVTTIRFEAFGYLENLKNVTFENGSVCTNIGSMAFYGCCNLASITIPASTPPELGSDVFSNGYVPTIYVPEGSVETYKNADSWKVYSEKIKAISEPHIHGSGADAITFDKAWESDNSLPSEAGSYYLTKDVTLSGSWSVSANINLCLNGHNIVRNGGNCITINNGATLSVYDCSSTQHKFAETADGDKAGLWVLDETNGTHVVTGGCIMGVNPTQDQIDGIGVFINNGGTFNLYGGNIVGNKATKGGGGVMNGGSFNMFGGNITGNIAGSCGGGVYNNGTLTMTGGSITGNTGNQGGGVYVGSGTLSLGGTAQITGNTADSSTRTANNLYLLKNKMVTLGTKTASNAGNDIPVPADGMSVGVTMETPGVFTGSASKTQKKYFSSDSADYFVNFDTDHLELKSDITLADILNTVESGFPTSSDGDAPSNAWTNSNDEKMFCYESDCYIAGESDGDFYLSANTILAKDGTNYKHTKDGVTVTFIMNDGALISVVVQGLTDYEKLNGTYTGSHVHSFTYEASGDKLIATCANIDGKCDLTDKKVTLTLTAEDAFYDGAPYDGAATDDDTVKFAETTGKTISIEYWTAGESAEKLEAVPADAGSYAAKVTVTFGENQSASAEKTFTINPRIVIMHAGDGKWEYDEYSHLQPDYFEDEAAENAKSMEKWGTDEVLPGSTGFAGEEGFENNLV